MYLWIKALHVIFMVTWFAGLFYLPRLFIYHLQAQGDAEHQRFCLMEKRLYGIMSIGMLLTWAFGIALLWLNPGFLQMGWLHAKLALVVALSAFHGWLKLQMRSFVMRANPHSDRFWRWANEAPVLVLFGAVILVIVKPF